MAVKGVFASDSGIVGDRKGDFASALLATQPTGSAPLLALTSGMESAGAGDIVVTWFEENHFSGRINATNSAGTGASVIVDDVTGTVVGTIYMVEASGEHMFVTSISGSTLTVERGFAGTSVVTFDGSGTVVPIQRIGTAQEEGSAKPTAIAFLGAPIYNYMQIFRNAWDVTGTDRKVEWHTGDVVAKNKRDAGVLHAEDIERSLLFGRRSIGVQNNKPFRTMNGIIPQISTNATSQSTDVQYTDLRDWLKDVFARNIKGKPNERIAFCGNTVLSVLDTLAMTWGTMNLSPGETEFGMEITKWRTPFGTISLMTHPLMNESALWTKDLYVLHPGALRTRYLRKTHEDRNDRDGTRAGVDADYGVFTTEMCMELRAELTAGKYTGIDTADTSNL